MAERISEAEQAVMEALWTTAPMTAQEVADRVMPERGWTLTTVKTLLGRLLAKGAVAATEDGRRYLYRPALSRDSFASAESRRLIDRLFDGRLSPLVAHLAQRDEISATDIAEIEALLKALKS